MVIFAHRFFFFFSSTLNISSNSLLACKVSAEKVTNCFLGVPSYVPSHFSLVPFNILSLYFTFNKLMITWLCVVFFVLILYWALWSYFYCYTIYFLDILYPFCSSVPSLLHSFVVDVFPSLPFWFSSYFFSVYLRGSFLTAYPRS